MWYTITQHAGMERKTLWYNICFWCQSRQCFLMGKANTRHIINTFCKFNNMNFCSWVHVTFNPSAVSQPCVRPGERSSPHRHPHLKHSNRVFHVINSLYSEGFGVTAKPEGAFFYCQSPPSPPGSCLHCFSSPKRDTDKTNHYSVCIRTVIPVRKTSGEELGGKKRFASEKGKQEPMQF